MLSFDCYIVYELPSKFASKKILACIVFEFISIITDFLKHSNTKPKLKFFLNYKKEKHKKGFLKKSKRVT